MKAIPHKTMVLYGAFYINGKEALYKAKFDFHSMKEELMLVPNLC